MTGPRIRLAGALLVLAALAACAPASRVILLPQADGRPSAVTVSAGAGAAVLDRPYQTADISASGAVATGNTTAEQVARRHPQLLALRPQPPRRFVLHFANGGAELTPASRADLAEARAAAQALPGGEVVVTGHTDRVGSLEANDALSLQRARSIRDLLLADGLDPARVQAVGRGEREPAVPTEDGVAEPRNRRAEITVY